MSDQKAQIGVVGLAVMGKNLALNIESRGFTVGVYNRSRSRTDEMMRDHSDKKLIPSYTVEEFVNSLEKPRRILMMVKAGKPTDAVIEELLPLLDKGDVLIDGGNTNFHDTMARNAKLDESGINFIGMGVSGGELGALQGPSLMPGGQKEAYDLVEPILTQIAAKAEDGESQTDTNPFGRPQQPLTPGDVVSEGGSGSIFDGLFGKGNDIPATYRRRKK